MSAVTLVSRARYVGFVSLALTGVAVGAAWWPMGSVSSGHGSTVGFIIALVIGELIVLDEPDSTPIPAAIAVMGAFVLLGNGPVESVTVAAIGYGLGASLGSLLGISRIRADDALARLVGAWSLPTVVAAASLPAHDLLEIHAQGYPDQPLHLLAFATMTAAIVLGLPLWHAVAIGSPLGTAIGPLYAARLRATWLAGIALSAGAGLATLVHADLDAWGLLLTLLPLLAARSGLVRLASVRRTHAQTVRAMSRIPEYVHATPEGHGTRVADLVVSMARDLGLGASEVEALERAALLHEIGVVVADGDEHEHAEASARVVREVPHLRQVADIIQRHRDTQQMGIGLGQDRVPLAARILRTACDFDRLIAPTELEPGSWEAVRHFHVSAGHQHEPALIQALARTVDRGLLV